MTQACKRVWRIDIELPPGTQPYWSPLQWDTWFRANHPEPPYYGKYTPGTFRMPRRYHWFSRRSAGNRKALYEKWGCKVTIAEGIIHWSEPLFEV